MPKRQESSKGAVLEAAVLDLLRTHPEGLDIAEIRAALGFEGTQEHLNRRVRDLRDRYLVPCRRVKGRYLYFYEGERKTALDGGKISMKLRAQILNLAKGRCQMCGRTVAEDGIKLQADHKIPRAWGGETASGNLWAICTQCNRKAGPFCVVRCGGNGRVDSD